MINQQIENQMLKKESWPFLATDNYSFSAAKVRLFLKTSDFVEI